MFGDEMHRLILLRHAKAESFAESGGDFDRALTQRGRRDAALMAWALVKAGLTPDRVMISSARRAEQTWEAMADAFASSRIESDAALYLASREHIAQRVAGLRADPSTGVAMIVGHNPGLHEFALSLLEPAGDGAAAHERLTAFPTASAAVFAFGSDGSSRLERRLIPRDVGGGVL